MKNKDITKKNIAFLCTMMLIGSIFIIVYLAFIGNANQIYNDIIVECTAVFSSNKSAEKSMTYIMCFVGIVLYSLYFLFLKTKYNCIEKKYDDKLSKDIIIVLFAMVIGFFVVFNGYYTIVISALVISFLMYMIDKELVAPGVSVYFLSVYTFIAVYRIYVYLGGTKSINNTILAICSLLIAIIPLLFNRKKKMMYRVALVESTLIPFSLLIYVSNQYLYNGEKIIINVSNVLSKTVLGIVFSFVIVSVWSAIKKWKNIDTINDAIRVGTCITIMAFNRFDGMGAIMPTDMHHPFEDIIGYSQVFKLGQIPFKNFIPVSGMYSMIHGAIFDWFGDGGTFANYYITNNLFYLISISLIVFLLAKQIDKVYLLLISLVIYIQSYNRLAFVLPIMLLLIYPKLIERKNLWLKAWFITSLFHGLYYPLYGVATCIAFLPLGVLQIITYVKSEDFKQDIKKVSFWIGWILCISLAVACIFFLLGTLKHMLAMSGQSILADGISRFGQTIPVWFLGYLDGIAPSLRLALYYIVSFGVPVFFVWIVYAVALQCFGLEIENKKIKIKYLQNGLVAFSVTIMPIICYSYTTIRMDVDALFARSTGILIIGSVLLIVVSIQYMKDYNLKLTAFFIAVFFTSIVNTTGVFATESNNKLQAQYVVPENYIFIESEPVEKIGIGFINQDTYNSICETNNRFNNKDKNLAYLGDPAWFGYFYLLDIKGAGTMEISATVKSYSATQEAVENVRKNNALIGMSFSPINNYYFYHWLLASGEYYWDNALWDFVPNEGKYTKEEIVEQNKNFDIGSDLDIGKIAGSWGNSIDSLSKVFSNPNINCSLQNNNEVSIVKFDNCIDGDIADYIYIEFGNIEKNYNYILYNMQGEYVQEENKYANYLMKKNYSSDTKVKVEWTDENGENHWMQCDMLQGKLLIPVGAGKKWLFNNHEEIRISTQKDGVQINVPEITEIKMLKLREVL